MAAPEARNNPTETEGAGFTPAAQPQVEPEKQATPVGVAPASRNKMRWVTGAAYAICTVTFVGFLVALLGAYIVKEDAVIAAGAIIVTAAAFAWVAGTLFLAALLVGPLFNAFRRIFQSRQLR